MQIVDFQKKVSFFGEMVYTLKSTRKKEVSVFMRKIIASLFTLLALAAASFTLYLCAFAQNAVPYIEEGPEGPTAVLESFFAHLEQKDFPGAYAYLSNYASLGLENVPADQTAARLWSAHQEVWRFSVEDGYEMDGAHLTKHATVDCLNEKAVMALVGGLVQDKLAKAVEDARLKNEVYNEDGTYREELVHAALDTSLEELLTDLSPYIYTRSLVIHLENVDGKWLVTADADLINALTAGAAA